MKKEFIMLSLGLLLIVSCNQNYKISGEVTMDLENVSGEMKGVKENIIENVEWTVNKVNDTASYFKAKSAFVSAESKIEEILDMIEDYEDRSTINSDKAEKAIRDLEKAEELLNKAKESLDKGDYKIARELAVNARKSAKDVSRKLT